jgi:hypothetical protein
MPKKIQGCSMAHLVSVPLPNHGTTYTVISHQFVIDYSKTALQNAGFIITDEEYRCTADGLIAQGIYKLNYNSDPELSMMFAWTNSYNKQVKFKCVVGAYINQSGSVMISGDIGSWVRKHTGSADTEVKDTIDQYISNANMYYNQLCLDKASMEGVSLNKRRQAQLLGVLFAEYEILTTEQASMIREQMKKPQQVFANTDSLWAFYNFVTNSLQTSHPKTWMEDQRILHFFIGTICDFSAPVQGLTTPVPDLSTPPQDLSELVDPLYAVPGQTNILDQIAEVEMQLPDNQAVQEDVICADDLHQSEEIILDVIEAEETPFVEEESIEVTEDEAPWVDNEIIHYTDPAGNTFEAPVIPDPEDDEDLPQVPEPEIGNDAFEYKAEEANLDLIVEKQPESMVADFDLDFNTDNSEESTDNVPDFF